MRHGTWLVSNQWASDNRKLKAIWSAVDSLCSSLPVDIVFLRFFNTIYPNKDYIHTYTCGNAFILISSFSKCKEITIDPQEELGLNVSALAFIGNNFSHNQKKHTYQFRDSETIHYTMKKLKRDSTYYNTSYRDCVYSYHHSSEEWWYEYT